MGAMDVDDAADDAPDGDGGAGGGGADGGKRAQRLMVQRLEVEWVTWEQWNRIARACNLDTGEGLRGRPQGQGARQLQMLMGIVGGLETAEIARTLSISPKTAEGYIADLYDKMQVDRRCRAVSKAWRASLNE